jgi:hypothetical protein
VKTSRPRHGRPGPGTPRGSGHGSGSALGMPRLGAGRRTGH